MAKIISIFGASDCYGLTKDLSFTIRMTCEMKDKVDQACLREAVALLEQRFSFLKVSLRKNLRSFYYVENPRPWVVLESDLPIPLNCEESNDQLIAFSFYQNTIYINVYHGQMDGAGIYRLSKALLYYYCCLRYKRSFEVPDVALPEDQILPEESSDVYHDFYNKNRDRRSTCTLSPQKLVKHPMQLDRMGLVRSNRNRRSCFKLTVPQADLMKYCSSYDGSPVTAIALILAEGIYGMHPDSDREIVVGIPVNLRPALGVHHSIASTYSKIYIPYSEKIRARDFETQGTLCRGIVIRYSDHELLRAQTMDYCSRLAMLQRIPLTCLKQLAAQTIAHGMKKAETADVTYVGKFQFGEIEDCIQAIFFDVDAYGIGIQVLLTAYADKFFITVDQDWEEKDYIEAFLVDLKKRGISYQVNYDGKLATPEMRNI